MIVCFCEVKISSAGIIHMLDWLGDENIKLKLFYSKKINNINFGQYKYAY